MTKKTTKRAFMLSLLSLLMCCTMLLGTTFAWFTDTVTSTGNRIVAGTLEVDLLKYVDDAYVSVSDEAGKDIFDDANGVNWEPGKTEIVYLAVANLGSLALKYDVQLKVTDGGLAGALEYAVIDGQQATVAADIDTWAELAEDANVGPMVAGYMPILPAGQLEAGKTNYFALAVHMREDAGNEYQSTDEDPKDIVIDVKVVASQLTAETDSFGKDYDANAPFSVWNGVVPTEMPDSLVVDGATQTVHVKDAAAFAYLSTLSADWVTLYTDGQGTTYTNYANGAGGNYYYSGKWKVSLEADIDLNNCALAPVDIVFGQGTGATAFNGNGHTIRNITAGLFKDGTRASFSDLTLENVKATNGALAGSVNNPVTDVTVKNATIFGVDYVGGLVGKTYSSVARCRVIDSSVVATGKEAGGLIGYAEANSKGSTITNNVVNNVSVYADNRAAGLVAQPNTTVKVYNNTVDTVTVGAADTSQYQPGAVVSNALAPANVYDNTVKNANVATKAATADDNTAFGTAIADGADTVFLSSGNYVIPSAAKGKEGLTFVGTGDTSVAVTKVGTGGENCDYGLDGSTVVFENITITTNSSTYIGYARCNATYNNCTINGTYTLYGDSVFNNCTFNVTGDVYNVWTWGAPTATFNNCTFNSDGKALLLYGTANTKLTLNDCTFNDNGGLTDLKAAIEIGNDYNKSYELIVNNTTVNGYEINDKGINTGSTLWANKNSMGKDKLNVVVDGTDVY